MKPSRIVTTYLIPYPHKTEFLEGPTRAVIGTTLVRLIKRTMPTHIERDQLRLHGNGDQSI